MAIAYHLYCINYIQGKEGFFARLIEGVMCGCYNVCLDSLLSGTASPERSIAQPSRTDSFYFAMKPEAKQVKSAGFIVAIMTVIMDAHVY